MEKHLMLEDLEIIAQALSDPTRLRILKLLAIRHLCACQLSYLLAASQSRVSQNLTILKYAHLVEDTRDGRMVFYSPNRPIFDEAMRDLRTLIDQPSLEGIADMQAEKKRWQAMPADLDAICPTGQKVDDGQELPESAGAVLVADTIR
jgi:ArsR family transcriptional regulator, arsenate/arsenite/antimonite-responsive transcriptional repressor